MPKRGAAKQLTKDGREGSDDEEEEQVEMESMPKEDRVGLPKRKGGAAPKAPAPTPSGGFGFLASSSSFGPGATAPASTSGFGFLNTPAPAAPAATSTGSAFSGLTSNTSAPTAAKPAFGGGFGAGSFSFGASTGAAAPATPSSTGFDFGQKSSNLGTQSGFGGNASGFGSFGSSTASNAPSSGLNAGATSFQFGAAAKKDEAPKTDAAKPAATTAFGFGAAPTTKPTEAPSTGFGFGSSTTFGSQAAGGGKPFAFGQSAPAATAAPAAPAAPASDSNVAASFSFGSKPADAPMPAASFAIGTTPSADASKPASTFGFGSTSTPAAPSAPAAPSSSNGEAATQTNGTNSSTAPESAELVDDEPATGEVAYYTAIRGLNVSISAFIAKLVKDDPFTDLTAILPSLGSQYGKYVDETAEKNGWRPAGRTSAPASAPSPAPAPAAQPAAQIKPPTFAPPAAGTFSLSAPSTSSSSAPTGAGFTPSLPASTSSSSSSPFVFGGFGAAKPAPAATPKPSSTVADIVKDTLAEGEKPAQAAETASTPFKFNAPSSTATPSSETKKTTGLFAFGPSGPIHPATPDSKSFTPSKNLEDASPAKLGKFGPGGTQPQLSFGGAKASPNTTATRPAAFGFGSASSATGEASTAFSFNSGASKSTPSTGFSFNGVSSTDKPTFGQGAPATFVFGNRSVSTASVGTSGSDTAAGEADAPQEGSITDLATAAGEGEEDEETVLEQRTKLYALTGGEWKVKGLGIFKVKKSKEDGKRRLLMRTEGSGHIVLNMALGASFKPSAEGKGISFIGFDANGKPETYRMAVKTEDIAKDVVAKLQAEVQEVKKV